MLSLPRLHEIGHGGWSVCKRGKAFRQNGCSHCRDCTKSALEGGLSANVARGGRDTLFLHAYAGDNIRSIRTGNSNGIGRIRTGNSNGIGRIRTGNGIGRIRTGIGINSIRFTTGPHRPGLLSWVQKVGR